MNVSTADDHTAEGAEAGSADSDEGDDSTVIRRIARSPWAWFLVLAGATAALIIWVNLGDEQLWDLPGRSVERLQTPIWHLPDDISGYIVRDCLMIIGLTATLLAGLAAGRWRPKHQQSPGSELIATCAWMCPPLYLLFDLFETSALAHVAPAVGSSCLPRLAPTWTR